MRTPSPSATVLLVSLTLGVSACAPQAAVALQGPKPATLDEINRFLAGDVTVSVELASGYRHRRVRDARLSPDSVWYRGGVPGDPSRLEAYPISDVDRIVYEQRSGGGRGAVIGAIPGALLFGASVWLAKDAEGFGGPALVFGGFALGGVLGVIGGGAGYYAGEALLTGGQYVVYQAPVERYLSPSERALR